MKGTEKQIKWAEEIQAATLETIDEAIKDGQKYAGNPKADALLERLAAQREAIANCEYAGDMIECFSVINKNDPLIERSKNFASACKITVANNAAQRKMLGR